MRYKIKKTKKQRQQWWANLTDSQKEAYIKKKQAQKAEERRENPVKRELYPVITQENKAEYLERIYKKNPWLKELIEENEFLQIREQENS